MNFYKYLFLFLCLSCCVFDLSAQKLSSGGYPTSSVAVNDQLFYEIMSRENFIHLVWDDNTPDRIEHYWVEKSFDGSSFFPVSEVSIDNLFDIHANDYPPDMTCFYEICYSTEKGWGRFIYNEYLDRKQNANEGAFWFRIKMKHPDGTVSLSRTLSFIKTKDGLKFSTGRQYLPPKKEAKITHYPVGKPLPLNSAAVQQWKSGGGGCPSVQNVTQCDRATGSFSTYQGNCCEWEERQYDNYSQPCPGFNCCFNISGSNSTGNTSCWPCGWDDCCVHNCSQFSSCSCGWPCCTYNGTINKVYSSTTHTTNLPNASISSQQNINCAGNPQGSATITVSGGVGPFNYQWSNGAMGSSQTAMLAGTYFVTITDSRGCTDNVTITITEPAPFQANAVTTPATCPTLNNGAVDITPSGGTSPYSYLWSNGATTQDISGLGSGSFSITLTDNTGCQQMLIVSVPSSGTPTGPAGQWTWEGTYSNDWFNGCNWDKRSVPNLSSNVVIPGSTPTNPLVFGTGVCFTLWINEGNGGRLTIDAASFSKLTVSLP